MRAVLGALAVVLVAGTAYVLGSQAREVAPARSERSVPDPAAPHRIDELERRVAHLEARAARDDAGTRTPPDPGQPAAPAPQQPETGRPRAESPSRDAAPDAAAIRAQWTRRVLDGAHSNQRLARLRDALSVLKKNDPNGVDAFLEELARTFDAATPEGAEVQFQLGYRARSAGDYPRADEYFHRVESLFPADSEQYAAAQFQLAWNRRYSGEREAARDLFRRAAEVPGVDPGTRAAARYAVAQLLGELGDEAGARAELERLLEEARDHSTHLGVQHYAGLATKLLATR